VEKRSQRWQDTRKTEAGDRIQAQQSVIFEYAATVYILAASVNLSVRKTAYPILLLTIASGLGYFAYFRPWYVANETYLGALILLEALIGAIWMYKRAFFPVVLLAFLLAGVDLPLASVWTVARWAFLGIGAFVGCLMLFVTQRLRFVPFHFIAFFAAATAALSAFSSSYPWVVLAKALSLLLLFVYAGTGVRMAVIGREQRFFSGLLLGCEIFVSLLAVIYATGLEIMGNPNSLGAVTGVIGAPILLWGAFLEGKNLTKYRRWLLYGICMYLLFHSQARAGLAAALISCGLLCISLRKYKVVVLGLIFLLIMVAIAGIFAPDALTSVTKSTLYKSGEQSQGLLASRREPWQTAIDNIRLHLWLGMGIGTTMSENQAGGEEQRLFASYSKVTAEHGSSYLAILSGVGVFGAIPISLLLVLLLSKVQHTVRWMRTFQTPWHPAVPIAMLVVAGLVHAGFEDWMLAPGNYLCVFFWSLAFLLIDFAPTTV